MRRALKKKLRQVSLHLDKQPRVSDFVCTAPQATSAAVTIRKQLHSGDFQLTPMKKETKDFH